MGPLEQLTVIWWAAPPVLEGLLLGAPERLLLSFLPLFVCFFFCLCLGHITLTSHHRLLRLQVRYHAQTVLIDCEERKKLHFSPPQMWERRSTSSLNLSLQNKQIQAVIPPVKRSVRIYQTNKRHNWMFEARFNQSWHFFSPPVRYNQKYKSV